MADKQGQADIRDLFIDRLVKGFSDEELTFKSFVTSGPTSAREIRWVQKTAGFLTSPTTTGMTTDLIQTAEGARPVVIAQSWTRQTSYIKLFKAETETISDEDIKDNMVDILAAHVRDVTRAVQKKVNDHVWDVLTATQNLTLSGNTTAAWDTASYTSVDIALDIETAKMAIRQQNYEPTHIFLSPKDCKSVIAWVYTKGAQAPVVGNSLVNNAVLTQLFGLNVVVSNSVTASGSLVSAPQRACTYREFMSLKSATIEDPLIGIKVRVGEEGVALLTDPYACYWIKDTQT